MKFNKTFLTITIFLMLSIVSCDFDKSGAEKMQNKDATQKLANNNQKDFEDRINKLELDLQNISANQGSGDNAAVLEQLKKILREISVLKLSQEKMAKDIATLKASQGKGNQKQANQPTAAQEAKVKNIPIGNSMVLGNPDAPVTIIKWTDFQ